MEPLLTYARAIAVARCCLRPWHLSPLRAARPALLLAGLSLLPVPLARILLHWGRGIDLCAGPLLLAGACACGVVAVRQVRRGLATPLQVDALYVQGQLPQAEALLSHVLQCLERRPLLPEEQVATGLVNVGFCRLAGYARPEAAALFEQAVTLLEHAPEGPVLADALLGQALVVEEEAPSEATCDALRRAVSLYTAAGTAEQERLSVALQALADVLRRQGALAEAEEVMSRAVAVTEARASHTHALRRVHVLWSHAALLAAQGRHREAAASCQWATALLPEEGPLAAERAGLLLGQAESLQALGQSDEALSLQQRALELAGTAGPDCLHVERYAVHAVAESLLGRGDVAGASTHVERGLQRCEQAGVPELERAPLRFLRLRTRWAEGDFEQVAAEAEHLAATLTSQPRLLCEALLPDLLLLASQAADARGHAAAGRMLALAARLTEQWPLLVPLPLRAELRRLQRLLGDGEQSR